MIFVDTGYLFAVASPGDQLYPRAMKWAEAMLLPMLTTDYVLWEMINGYSRTSDRRQAHALLDNIQSSPAWQVIRASEDLYRAGLSLHRRYDDKDWSLTDCISFHVMRERGLVRALTHDHHFEQAGFEALLRRNPP